jgi:hypothetical protein
MPHLHLDWASHESCKYAVLHWHYSKSLPGGKLVKVGVWEDKKFIGCVLFSRGANMNIGKPYGLDQTECVELTRIALSKHQTPVTRIVSIAIRMLKKLCPEIKLIVSYADADQGHTGKIYQAGNWIFTGLTNTHGKQGYKIHGAVFHGKTVYSKYGKGRDNVKWLRENIDPKAEEIPTKGKYKYLMPLDSDVAKSIVKLKKNF